MQISPDGLHRLFCVLESLHFVYSTTLRVYGLSKKYLYNGKCEMRDTCKKSRGY